MKVTVTYPTSIELANQYVVLAASGIANAETDAIIVRTLDVDPTAVASAAGNSQATLYIDYVAGSLTNATIRIYDSYVSLASTASDWYQEVIESDSSGVATLFPYSIVLTSSARIAYQLPMGAYRCLKITVASSGTITNSSIKLNLALRYN